MKTSGRTPWLPIDAAQEEIATLTRLIEHETDARRRMKTARRLAFAASSLAFSASRMDLPTIEAGIDALRLARKVGASTDDLNRSIAWLSNLRLELMGYADGQVLCERKKTVALDAACLVASGAESLDPEIWTGSNNVVLGAMNRGEFFLISLSADGQAPLVARIVDAPEPILKPAEYQYLGSSTAVGMVRIEQAKLRFGAPENLQGGIVIPALNGILKVQLFLLERSRSYKFILVACKGDDASPALTEIPEIR